MTTIAVCTLFSSISPVHEWWIKGIILKEYPEVYVPISSELVGEFREYSRVSTIVLNAYLGPITKKYAENSQDSVRESRIAVVPHVAQSNGSIISITGTAECPIRTAVFGPSADAVGATYTGRQYGIDKIITLDMGGTSVDINLVRDGETQVSYERMVEGYPARTPMIDTITVGAGGGSTVIIDEGGALKAGPRSAGTVSDPACYVRGGEGPTVTDTNILLGKLNRHKILSGRMDVDRNLAYGAIQKKISGKLSLNAEDATVDIISVVSSNMVHAVRVISVGCGYDACEFTLMASGGAGPLHAREVAREFGITQVLLPPAPGMLCSLGFLMADTRFDLSQSHIMIVAPQNLSEMNHIFSQLVGESDRVLENEGIAEEDHTFFYSLSHQYERQNYEITVKFPTGEVAEGVLSGLMEQFHQEYERFYGYYDKRKNIRMVNYRIGAVGTTDKPDLDEYPVEENPQIPAPIEVCKARFEGSSEYLDTNIYQHVQLPRGCIVGGPVITEQMGSTSITPPGWQAYNDPPLNLITTYHGGETA